MQAVIVKNISKQYFLQNTLPKNNSCADWCIVSKSVTTADRSGTPGTNV